MYTMQLSLKQLVMEIAMLRGLVTRGRHFSRSFVVTRRYCVACRSSVVTRMGKRSDDSSARARKRSFVGAAAKSMHFAGRQFVRVDVRRPVCVRTSACMRATLASMQPDVVDRLAHIASQRIPLATYRTYVLSLWRPFRLTYAHHVCVLKIYYLLNHSVIQH